MEIGVPTATGHFPTLSPLLWPTQRVYRGENYLIGTTTLMIMGLIAHVRPLNSANVDDKGPIMALIWSK